MKVSRDHVVGVAIGLLAGVVIVALAVVFSGRTKPAAIYISPPAATVMLQATATPAAMRVYISGEVVAPAVYEIPTGGIIQDVITVAGGFSAAANTEVVNLALPLADGMHIHVPGADEAPGVPVVSQGQRSSTVLAGGLININTASLEELDLLPGIGPGTAQKIIDHRLENGPFGAVEALMDVSGIGPSKFDQIKDLITLE